MKRNFERPPYGAELEAILGMDLDVPEEELDGVDEEVMLLCEQMRELEEA